MSTTNDQKKKSVRIGHIEPGEVNEERTHCRCSCCHEIFELQPEWNADTECPNCEESMFDYLCDGCNYGVRSNEPAFPHQPCDNCGETKEEQEEEERVELERRARLAAERERVQQGAKYREAIKNKTIQKLYPPPPLNAKYEHELLHMSGLSWMMLKPLVIGELEKQGLEAKSIMTASWFRLRRSAFLHCWQEEHEDALKEGFESIEKAAGTTLVLGENNDITVKLRSLREYYMGDNEAMMPTSPGVTIYEKAWFSEFCKTKKGLESFVEWETREAPGDDPREIYRSDGIKSLSFFEFLLWSARVGGLNQPSNPVWSTQDDWFATVTAEPIAYVPIFWCGKPVKFEIQEKEDFARWHWLRAQARAMPMEVLKQKVRKNALVCSRCYAPAAKGSELIECECGKVLYCSKDCQEKDWLLHSIDPSTRHTSPMTRTCLNCGATGTDMKRCGKCLSAYFCDKECQEMAWSKKRYSVYSKEGCAEHKLICKARK